MPASKDDDQSPIIIKKYANRRLYNTQSSSYVTLDDLRQLISDDVDFIVQDAKSGEDLTRAVLTQILAEAEQSGASLLPVGFLRQVIAMYGDGMGWMLPQYLECMTQWFEQHQRDVRQNMEGAFGTVFPVGPSMDAVNEMTRRNMAAFDQAMRAFWPQAPGMAAPAAEESEDAGLDDLRRQMAEMQKRLEKLSKQ